MYNTRKNLKISLIDEVYFMRSDCNSLISDVFKEKGKDIKLIKLKVWNVADSFNEGISAMKLSIRKEIYLTVKNEKY